MSNEIDHNGCVKGMDCDGESAPFFCSNCGIFYRHHPIDRKSGKELA